MKFVIIPFIVLILSSLAKLVVRAGKGEKLSWQLVSWVFSWAGGIPSTHSAFITSSAYLVGKYEGFGPVFGFCIVVAVIVMYNLLEDKEQYEWTQKHWQDVLEKLITKITRNEKLWDMYGHTLPEVIAGIVFGLFFTFILDKLI